MQGQAIPNPPGIKTFQRLVFGKEKPGHLRLQGKGFSRKCSWLMHVDDNYVPTKLVNEQCSVVYDEVRVDSNQIRFLRPVQESDEETSYWERVVFKLTKNRDDSFTLLGGTTDIVLTTTTNEEDWDDGLPVRVDVCILREEK